MSIPVSPYIYSKNNTKPASLRIIFQKDGEPDDILSITPVESGTEFHVIYVQNTTANRIETYINHSDFNSYLRNVFHSVKYDIQKSKYVQFDVPSYSSTIIKTENLYDYLDVFFSQLRTLHNYWPFEIIGVSKPLHSNDFAVDNVSNEEPSLFPCNRRVTTRSQTRASKK